MKIAVLGASGRTGILVVEELLRRGHNVNGLTFKKPENYNEKVNWIFGDATNPESLKQCLDGVAAVISTLGHTKNTKTPIQTDSMKALVNILRGTNTRIVSMTGTRVRRDGDKPSLLDRFLNIGIKIVDPKRVSDGIDHAKVLQESGLNFTILRVLKLSKSEKLQNVHLTSGGPALNLISRATVAKLLVDLAESNDWTGEMPVASK